MHLQSVNVDMNSSNTESTSYNEKNINVSVCVDIDGDCQNKINLEVKDKEKEKEQEINGEQSICRICHCGESDVNIVQSLYDIEKISDNRSDCESRSTKTCKSYNLNKKNINLDTSLITPCSCSGSLRFVHHYCLQQWIRSSNNKTCELCKYHFKMSIRYKPFYKWQKLDMTRSERKKLFFNLLFNLISMICVFWSIYVLIERATLEARYGLLDWPFWTKMLVVSVGFLGGTVFLFVQLRLYLSIFLRWRQFNRIIVIHELNDDNLVKITKK